MPTRKQVLITGASSGIGEAAARRFAADGYDVCLNARRGEILEGIRAGLPAGNHLIRPGDYSDPGLQEKIAATIREHWGGLDALVNNAGIALTAPAIGGAVEDWRKPFDMMFDGAVGITRALAPLVRDGGRIIHVTSIHGARAERGLSAYAAAKAAINQYCRNLAVELAERQILVNAVAPGFVDTPMSVVDGVNELEGDWFRDNYVVGHHLPLRRAARPEEIAGVIAFLAGPDSSYITGQVITADGGLTITF